MSGASCKTQTRVRNETSGTECILLRHIQTLRSHRFPIFHHSRAVLVLDLQVALRVIVRAELFALSLNSTGLQAGHRVQGDAFKSRRKPKPSNEPAGIFFFF